MSGCLAGGWLPGSAGLPWSATFPGVWVVRSSWSLEGLAFPWRLSWPAPVGLTGRLTWDGATGQGGAGVCWPCSDLGSGAGEAALCALSPGAMLCGALGRWREARLW